MFSQADQGGGPTYQDSMSSLSFRWKWQTKQALNLHSFSEGP